MREGQLLTRFGHSTTPVAQHVHAGQQVQSATLDGADKCRRAPAAMAGGAGGAVGVPGLPPSSRVIGGWAPSQYLGRLANTAGVDPATIDRHGEWLAPQPPSSPTQEPPYHSPAALTASPERWIEAQMSVRMGHVREGCEHG